MKNDGNSAELIQEGNRSLFPWQRAWSILKANWPQLIYISLAAIAIPQCLSSWIMQQGLVSLTLPWQSGSDTGFFSILRQMEAFFLTSGLNLLIIFFLFSLGYLSFIQVALHSQDSTRPHWLSILRVSLTLLLGKGLLLSLLFFLSILGLGLLGTMGPGLGFLAQILLMTLCVLAAAAPVLLVLERRSPFQLMLMTVKMSYTQATGMSKWSAYFILLSYEMLLLGFLTLTEAGFGAFQHLDQSLGFPKSLWFHTAEALPFGVIPFLLEILGLTLSSFLFAVFAVLTTSFIADLTRIGRVKKAVSLSSWV